MSALQFLDGIVNSHPLIQLIFSLLFLCWAVALFFLPFFAWGIYFHIARQNSLLRSMVGELQRLARGP